MITDNDSDKFKWPDIFRKENVKLIVYFSVSSLLIFSLVSVILCLTHFVFIQDQPLETTGIFQLPEIFVFIALGLLAGAVFIIFGLFRFTITGIVNLIRLFIIIFIVLLTLVYASLK